MDSAYPDPMDIVLLLLTGCALALTILNALTIRKPPRPEDSTFEVGARRVSLLLPLRNEERNIEPLIASIAASLESEKQSEGWEVIALDDASTDMTSSKLVQAQSVIPRLSIISGQGPKPGWLGKPAAQEELFHAASGEFLVFMDADVRLESQAISSTIALMERRGWDFASPYPRQIALTFLERLIQPLLQWSWFASVPLRLAERFRIPSMAVANGQLFIVRRSALIAIDGFTSVKDQILEDIELARSLWRAGKSGSVFDGSRIASCRMYNGSRELIDGYSKSLWRAFGSPFGALFAITLLFASSILPLLIAITGNPWAWLAFFAITLSRLIASIRTRSFWQSFLLHPLSVLTLIWLVLRSFILKRSGRLQWRDRSIAP